MGSGRAKIDAQRGLLAAMTLGTSEVKTNAGQYHDETIADSLFPKTINDELLGDRQQARRDADAAAAIEKDAGNPGPGADLADQLLRKAGATTLMRAQAKQGRRSTFLSGAMGDVAAPMLTKKTTLGGY